jgi:1-acyl-sn-glycerol-3-phosphate acyltransferase
LVITTSTVVHCLVIVILAAGKFLAPEGPLRDGFRKVLASVAESWISINNLVLSCFRKTSWDLQIAAGLDREGCYLVNSNHQSWVDILVLQRCFNRRLPLLRFFLKSQLIWVPFLGVAWWALDFPFMRRHSRQKIAQKPGLKGKDLESARLACEKFKNIPVAMMNFPEGTRFTEEKRDRNGGQYKNLLLPRIGGIGQVLYSLGEQLDAVVDVTIIYPGEGSGRAAPTFWQLVSGQVPEIIVRSQLVEIPEQLKGKSFRKDKGFRRELDAWVNELWVEKDEFIASLLL